MLIVSQGTRI